MSLPWGLIFLELPALVLVRIVLWGQCGPLCPSGRATSPPKSHLLCLSYPDFPVVHWKPRPVYEEEKSGFHRDPANESTSQGRKSQKKGKILPAPVLLKTVMIIPAAALAAPVFHQSVCGR